MFRETRQGGAGGPWQQPDAVTELSLAGNAQSSFRFLARFTNLRELNLSRTQLQDFSQIDAGVLSKLSRLDVSGNPIVSLRNLPRMPALEFLNLDNCAVELNGEKVVDAGRLPLLGRLQITNQPLNPVAVVEKLCLGRFDLGQMRCDTLVPGLDCGVACYDISASRKLLLLRAVQQDPGAVSRVAVLVYGCSGACVSQLLSVAMLPRRRVEFSVDGKQDAFDFLYVAVSYGGVCGAAVFSYAGCERLDVGELQTELQSKLIQTHGGERVGKELGNSVKVQPIGFVSLTQLNSQGGRIVEQTKAVNKPVEQQMVVYIPRCRRQPDGVAQLPRARRGEVIRLSSRSTVLECTFYSLLPRFSQLCVFVKQHFALQSYQAAADALMQSLVDAPLIQNGAVSAVLPTENKPVSIVLPVVKLNREPLKKGFRIDCSMPDLVLFAAASTDSGFVQAVSDPVQFLADDVEPFVELVVFKGIMYALFCQQLVYTRAQYSFSKDDVVVQDGHAFQLRLHELDSAEGSYQVRIETDRGVVYSDKIRVDAMLRVIPRQRYAETQDALDTASLPAKIESSQLSLLYEPFKRPAPSYASTKEVFLPMPDERDLERARKNRVAQEIAALKKAQAAASTEKEILEASAQKTAQRLLDDAWVSAGDGKGAEQFVRRVEPDNKQTLTRIPSKPSKKAASKEPAKQLPQTPEEQLDAVLAQQAQMAYKMPYKLKEAGVKAQQEQIQAEQTAGLEREIKALQRELEQEQSPPTRDATKPAGKVVRSPSKPPDFEAVFGRKQRRVHRHEPAAQPDPLYYKPRITKWSPENDTYVRMKESGMKKLRAVADVPPVYEPEGSRKPMVVREPPPPDAYRLSPKFKRASAYAPQNAPDYSSPQWLQPKKKEKKEAAPQKKEKSKNPKQQLKAEEQPKPEEKQAQPRAAPEAAPEESQESYSDFSDIWSPASEK